MTSGTSGSEGANEHAESGLDVRIAVRLGGFRLDAGFAVPAGLTVLFGPSGAGKSLTLQAIAGLVGLSGGSVRLGGRVLAEPARGIALPARERHIGYVPQHYALFPHLSVAENVAFALPRPMWDRDARKARALRAAELLALVRLAGFDERRPRELSGGQAQRVALARALAAGPEALLLDEPLGALDAPTRAAVRDDLRRVVIESGVPALVVTHDLAEARTLGDRMVVLVGGTVVLAGGMRAVLARPPTAEAALLLGWRNVVPVRRVPRDGPGALVELAGGQRVRVRAGSEESDRAWEWEAVGLALHGDQLELLPAGAVADGEQASGGALRGMVRAAADRGAHYRVSIALDALDRAAGEPAPEIAVTCSPREWARLGLAIGEPVVIRVPEGAARLVCGSGTFAGASTNQARGER